LTQQWPAQTLEAFVFLSVEGRKTFLSMTDVIHVDEQNFLPTLKTVILKQRSKKRAGIKREKRKQREEVETED